MGLMPRLQEMSDLCVQHPKWPQYPHAALNSDTQSATSHTVIGTFHKYYILNHSEYFSNSLLHCTTALKGH